MRDNSNFLLSALFTLFTFLIQHSGSEAQEKIVFNETIEWAWSPRTELWYGANSFYWWHRKDVNPAITNFGEMPDTSWVTPYDYMNGTFWLRFEVLEQPTSDCFSVQFGIWQDIDRPGGWLETCSALSYLSGGTGSCVEKNIGKPDDWWQMNKEVKVDFTRPEDFYRIGILLWKGKGSCIPYGQGWSASRSQCDDPESEAVRFFPMKARLTVVAVASGYTFSGWENYSGSAGTSPSSGSASPLKR